VFAAAMTARKREMAVPMKWAREAAGEIVGRATFGDVALVFGNETKGLSNDDVALCHMPVKIPVSEAYSSLNLGAAVQVLCYELRMAALDPGTAPGIEFEPATHEQIEGFYAHRPGDHRQRCFNPTNSSACAAPQAPVRADRSKDEINILRGMLSAFEKK
jgi:tRNA/rRNA methyltransferase